MATVFVPCIDAGVNHPDFDWENYSAGDAIAGWQVVKTIRYESNQLGCEPLTLAFIAQEEVPPETQWDCYQFPAQAIQLEVSEVGQPQLGFSFLYTDDLPAIDVNVPAGYTPISEGEYPQMQRIDSEWFTDRFQTYLPQSASPVSTIYLVWCKQQISIAA